MLTLHVDDLGVAGDDATREWTYTQLESRFGKLKRECWDFVHVGHHYTQDRTTKEMCSDLHHFVASIHETPLPSRDLEAPLNEKGVTDLRSNNGRISYATGGRPGACGRCAVSQQNICVTSSIPTWSSGR